MNEDHSAVKLGEWIKDKRIAKSMTLCEFAKSTGMNVCKASELMIGVGAWYDDIRLDGVYFYEAINQALKLSSEEIKDFEFLLYLARKNPPLKITDRFTRDDLYPIFAVQAKKITPEDAERIVDLVLKPLE